MTSEKMTFQRAKAVLNNSDKDRLLCAFFHLKTPPEVNMDAAAADFGSATPGAFRTMYYTALKKMKEGDSKRKVDDHEPGEAPKTPKKSPRKSKKDNKKTDVKLEEAEDGESNGDTADGI